MKYAAGGHGSSDAPGSYFWLGVVALLVALVGFWLGSPWTFRLGLLFGLPLFGWSFVATREGYGNRCTACDHRERSYPWSM
jgi:hypothetical protein